MSVPKAHSSLKIATNSAGDLSPSLAYFVMTMGRPGLADVYLPFCAAAVVDQLNI